MRICSLAIILVLGMSSLAFSQIRGSSDISKDKGSSEKNYLLISKVEFNLLSVENRTQDSGKCTDPVLAFTVTMELDPSKRTVRTQEDDNLYNHFSWTRKFNMGFYHLKSVTDDNQINHKFLGISLGGFVKTIIVDAIHRVVTPECIFTYDGNPAV